MSIEQARRRVRREPDVADAPGAAKLLRHLPAAAGAQRQLDAAGRVQPVERQQIDRVDAQQRERLLQLRFELGGIFVGAQLRLQHEGAARVARQRLAQLLLAGAVAARGLEVVDADRQRARRRPPSTLAWLAAPTRALRFQLCCARMPPHENTDMSMSVRPNRR